MEVSGQSHAPSRLTSRERAPVLTEWLTVWAPQPVSTFKEKKNILPMPGFELQIFQ